VIGGSEYTQAMNEVQNVLSSSNCHTLDRNNFRAQKDSCGIGIASDRWRLAVDKLFNVTYWPYVQVSTAYDCVSLFFTDSYFNLVLLNARSLLASSVILISAISLISL